MRSAEIGRIRRIFDGGFTGGDYPSNWILSASRDARIRALASELSMSMLGVRTGRQNRMPGPIEQAGGFAGDLPPLVLRDASNAPPLRGVCSPSCWTAA